MRCLFPLKWIFRGWYLILIALFVACQSDKELEPEPERTILFYLAADCDLDTYIRKDVNEILTGMVGVNGRVVIYLDASNKDPQLLTIKQEGNHCVLDTIETYQEENSVSAEVLNRVTHRVRELYPSKSYGLVLGSHGTGWIPMGAQFGNTKAGNTDENRPRITRYFGADQNLGASVERSPGIELNKLVDALPGGYEFIAFDVCLMGNIEVLYALRHKAKYIIASPVEILLDGFPYERVMSLLWGGEEKLIQLCQVFRDFYESGESVVGESWGMLSLVRTAYLDEVANLTKTVLSGKKEQVATLNPSEVWRYPLVDYRNDVFFDFSDYIRKYASEAQYLQFKQLLSKMVYTAYTTEFSDVIIVPENVVE